jgi:hypothetical protein
MLPRLGAPQWRFSRRLLGTWPRQTEADSRKSVARAGSPARVRGQMTLRGSTQRRSRPRQLRELRATRMRRAEWSIQVFRTWRTSQRDPATESPVTRQEASTEVLKRAAVNLGLAFLGLTGALRTAIGYRLISERPGLCAGAFRSMFCKVSVLDKGCNCRFGKISPGGG